LRVPRLPERREEGALRTGRRDHSRWRIPRESRDSEDNEVAWLRVQV
jgi:hypothetical protein